MPSLDCLEMTVVRKGKEHDTHQRRRTHTIIPWILARHGLLGALYSGHNSTACGIGLEETLEIFVCPCSTTRWPNYRREGSGRWKVGRGWGSRSTALTYGASGNASHKLRLVLSFIVRSCVPDICLLPYYMNCVVPDVRVMATN